MSQTYEQFGKYLLLEKVAAGGMAEIYLAKSGAANGLNKFFAIKRILPQFSNNEDFVSMFKEEAKVAINLNHSNVASIFDFGIEQGQFYLVMDYIEGRNLRQIINELKKANKSFSIDQALFLVKETAAGLDHAHRCTDATNGRPLNITHRDMSPQNIMVSFEGEVKVIDFGIAKAETEAEDTKAGTLKGKFSYMSPEQAEGQPIDPRTDVFALGIVLWELLANDRLFTGSNEAAILRKVRDCQIPPIRKINPTVPQELERIVMKSLAKDRNIRYQTAANLHRDLNRFLNTQYPDFSPQDFSIFIKESFKTAFQDGRDKLVRYSKLINNDPPPLIVLAPQMPKESPPPPPAVAEGKPVEAKVERELPEVPKGFSADQNLKINLDGLRAAGAQNKNLNSNNLNVIKPPVGVSTAVTSANTAVSSGNFSPQTKVTQLSQVSNSYASKSADTSQIMVKGLVAVALVVGGWYGYKTYTTPTPTKTPAKPTTIGQTEQASKAVEVKISVGSSPDNAQIFVNGKDTGYKTPAIITLAANKETEIVIHKEGFVDHKITRSFNAVAVISPTLQAVASVTAYLNIRVSDGNSFTKISVNGKELLEKPPIMKYPITPDKEITVSAYNPITKMTDERKITAKSNESVDVQLVLGRVPASK